MESASGGVGVGPACATGGRRRRVGKVGRIARHTDAPHAHGGGWKFY